MLAEGILSGASASRTRVLLVLSGWVPPAAAPASAAAAAAMAAVVAELSAVVAELPAAQLRRTAHANIN